MEITLYSGINLFCILVVAIILINHTELKNKSPSGKSLRMVLYGSIVLFVIDFIWGLLYNDFTKNDFVEWFLNAIYYAAIFSIGILWIVYVSNVIEEPIKDNRKGMITIVVLIVMMTIFLLLSQWTDWSFHTETLSGEEMNWPVFITFLLMLILPLLVTCAHVLYKIYKTDVRTYRHEYLTAIIFVIPVIICDIFNILWADIPMLSIGLTLGIVIMYYNMQNQMITLDPLTQINNRTYLEKYFEEVSTKENLNGRNLYFAMMDLDHFRAINDEFGYDEGDHALKIVANILNEACGNDECFLARVGGDEFAAIQICENRSVIERICKRVEEISVETSRDLEYTISISIGVIEMEEEMPLTKMIDIADSEMFRVKQERRKNQASG